IDLFQHAEVGFEHHDCFWPITFTAICSGVSIDKVFYDLVIVENKGMFDTFNVESLDSCNFPLTNSSLITDIFIISSLYQHFGIREI
ncbi:6709_t:CDS:2, partial [Scutellospora calospora]